MKALHGRLIEGASAGDLLAKLDPDTAVEGVRLGDFAIVEGRRHLYFCLVADVRYQALHPRYLVEAAEAGGLVRDVLWGTAVYPVAVLRPSLERDRETGEVRQARTLPEHGARVRPAAAEDVFAVFGAPGEEHFAVGRPLELDVPVCLHLPRLVQRSAGVFGMSGTGKTFLTRLLLAGLVRSRVAAALVFDAHNEYGWEGRSEEGRRVKGLKQLFPGRVLLYTLDPESTRMRGVRADGALYLAHRHITPEDVLLLSDSLNLSPTAYESLAAVHRREGRDWFGRFLALDAAALEEYAREANLHPGALAALRRKLERVAALPFLRPEVPADPVGDILAWLGRGGTVVVEFGRTPALGYMLAANILTRRLHAEYVARTERALAAGEAEPTPLVIAVEEAHRFLDPAVSRETIFGTIAREMRKYNVTLLVVDQRPSRIDAEVLSQIGTRLACRLEDEDDVNALLAGAREARVLRHALATLDHRQQALIFGQALPMPVLVRTRPYDETFYREITAGTGGAPFPVPAVPAAPDSAIAELFGDVEPVDI